MPEKSSLEHWKKGFAQGYSEATKTTRPDISSHLAREDNLEEMTKTELIDLIYTKVHIINQQMSRFFNIQEKVRKALGIKTYNIGMTPERAVIDLIEKFKGLANKK